MNVSILTLLMSKKAPQIACMLGHVQLFATRMDCSSPGSSVHGISQAEILEQVAISSSRGSFLPKDWTWVCCVSCIADRFFTVWVIREAPKIDVCVRVGSFQGIFLTQGSNPPILHWQADSSPMSHLWSPRKLHICSKGGVNNSFFLDVSTFCL